MNRLTAKDIYEQASTVPFKYKFYKKVLNSFHKNLMKEVLDSSEGVVLPKQLGVLRVMKAVNRRGMALDFQKTKEYGVKVYHTNMHSDGYFAFFNWNKDHPYGIFGFKNIYKFVATRTNKRELARKIKTENSINKYLEK